MPSFRKGFTLIELLVVIAIIGILSSIVVTSVLGQKNRAKDVSFQSTASSVRGAANICCNGGGGALASAAADGSARGDVCNPASGSIYPASTNLGSAEVVRDCSDVQGFSIKLAPGTSNSGTIDYALCDHDSCQYIPK